MPRTSSLHPALQGRSGVNRGVIRHKMHLVKPNACPIIVIVHANTTLYLLILAWLINIKSSPGVKFLDNAVQNLENSIANIGLAWNSSTLTARAEDFQRLPFKIKLKKKQFKWWRGGTMHSHWAALLHSVLCLAWNIGWNLFASEWLILYLGMCLNRALITNMKAKILVFADFDTAKWRIAV